MPPDTDGETLPGSPHEVLAAVNEQALRLAGLLGHEARSPAAALVSLLDVLDGELASPPPPVVAEVLEQMRIAAGRILRGLAHVQEVARRPGRYRFVRLAALVEAFDRRRPHRSAREGRTIDAEVVAEPAPLLDSLAAAGAALDPAPARVGISSRGITFTTALPAAPPALPAFLAERGATLTQAGPGATLLVPFRLLDP